MVSVNNNYLKLNPIYDVNGKPVNVPDESTTTLTILVPEKYKTQEKEIQELYTNFHTYYYYWFDDLYANTIKPLDYNPSVEKELLLHHKPLPVSIIFVKNNQDYYSYMPWVLPERENTVKDPIAVIVNDRNMGQFLTSEYIINGYFWGKSSSINYMNPMQTESFQIDINKSGIRNLLVSISPLYDAVGQSIQETRGKIGIYSVMYFVSILVVILVTLFSCINYIENNNRELSIKKIHGYSFWNMHKSLLANQFCIWFIANVMHLILYQHLNMEYVNISTWLIMPISIGALAIQIIVSIFAIKFNEPSKISETLKGA